MRSILRFLGMLIVLAAAILGVMAFMDVIPLADVREYGMRLAGIIAVIGIAITLLSFLLKKKTASSL